jgi:hypothetical protein
VYQDAKSKVGKREKQFDFVLLICRWFGLGEKCIFPRLGLECESVGEVDWNVNLLEK